MEFTYGEGHLNDEIRDFVLAWKNVRRVKPGIRTTTITKNYPLWLKTRGKGFTHSDSEIEEKEEDNNVENMGSNSEGVRTSLLEEKMH